MGTCSAKRTPPVEVLRWIQLESSPGNLRQPAVGKLIQKVASLIAPALTGKAGECPELEVRGCLC